MSLLSATEIHKAFGAKPLLAGATVHVRERERVGVVGRNGAGKSTLAKILASIEPADEGSVSVRKKARVGYLAQEPNLDESLGARANVERGLHAWFSAKERHAELSRQLESSSESEAEALLEKQIEAAAQVESLGGWERNHEIESVLGHLGIEELDKPTGQMSGGQQRRVALARVLVDAPDVLILDEPTNHLDADTVDWLERYLVSELKSAVVLVTHDRWLLDCVAERTLEVEGGHVHSYDGGYEDYLSAKAERLALLERTEKNRQNFLRTELEWLRRQPKARTGKQKARIGRAEAAKADHAPKDARGVLLQADVAGSGAALFEARGLSLHHPGKPDDPNAWIVRGLDLTVRPGERIGIVGPNGIGKTTLLKAILGELTPAEGSVTLGPRTKIGYLDQMRQGLVEEESILETLQKAVPASATETHLPQSYLERFGFGAKEQDKQVRALSGGERARLCLAQLLSSAKNLLLFDEPTNDLDTDTLSALEGMLAGYEGGVVLVTHDRYMLDRVATKILAFEPGGRVTAYAGTYQVYAAAKAQQAEKTPGPKTGRKESPSEGSPPKRKAGLSKNEQRELDGLMEKIEAAETRSAALETQLADPALYAHGTETDRAGELRGSLEQEKAEVLRLMERWETLEAKKGSSASS